VPPAPSERARRHPLALLAVLAAAVLAVVRSRPPPPRGADAPANAFSAERALAALRRVVGDGAPRPVGSEEHERVRERLLTELRALGLEPSVLEGAAATSTSIALARNVVARIPGRESAKSILLCAHYDSVAAGPGAGDDGSGVATLLEVARALREDGPARRPVDLLFTDAEECGLVGAQAYARPSIAQEVEVVVNADARGTGGPTYLFETSPGNADLLRLYARSVARPCATSAAYEVYKRMPNDTDLTVFKKLGIPGLNFAFIDGVARYHTPKDDLAHLSAASLQHEGDQVLGIARALAASDVRAKAEGDLVYADLLGSVLVRWPEGASLPASIAVLLLLVALAARHVRRGATSARAIARGLVLALATTAGTAVLALAIVRGVELVRGDPEAWAAHPLPLEIAILAAGAVLAGTLGRARSLEDADSAGAWIALALAGVAVSALVPGASYLFLLPAVAAVISRGALPAVVLVLVWIPLVLGLEQALGLRVPIALGAPAGALVAAAATASRWRSVGLPAAAAVISIGVACFVPAHTADAPAWLNLVHVDTDGEPRARLVAVAYGGGIPKSLRSEADFGTSPEPTVRGAPWTPAGFAAEVERSGAPVPLVDVVSTREEEDGRVLELRIRSPRRSPTIVLDVRGASVLSATVGERKVRGFSWPGSHRIFFGVPPEGIGLSVRAPKDAPGKLLVLDMAYGLPPGDARFANARPPTHVPRSLGDQWVVARSVDL
jgi:hypothetical protein